MSKTIRFKGTATVSGGGMGGGPMGAIIAVGVVVIVVLEWVVAHAVVLLLVTFGIGATSVGMYFLLIRYHERKGAIVAAGFAELHGNQARALPAQPQTVIHGGTHYHLDSAEAVEALARIVRGEVLPGPDQQL